MVEHSPETLASEEKKPPSPHVPCEREVSKPINSGKTMLSVGEDYAG